MILCKDCKPDDPCEIPDSYHIYQVKDYGKVSGEQAMMEEIYKHGPIACTIAYPDDFKYDYTGGIYEDKSGALNLVHSLTIVGYGEENGKKYWVGKNSIGANWGESGLFRIVRGVNNLGVETDCAWADPVDTWTHQIRHYTSKQERSDPANKEEEKNSEYLLASTSNDDDGIRGCSVKENPNILDVDTRNQTLKYKGTLQSMPTNFDWRNM